jgi:hypothetical protein
MAGKKKKKKKKNHGLANTATLPLPHCHSQTVTLPHCHSTTTALSHLKMTARTSVIQPHLNHTPIHNHTATLPLSVPTATQPLPLHPPQQQQKPLPHLQPASNPTTVAPQNDRHNKRHPATPLPTSHSLPHSRTATVTQPLPLPPTTATAT